jgi:hypothetical protein
MTDQLGKIETTFVQNVKDVQQLVNFDRVILDFAISALEHLRVTLSRPPHNYNNPALIAANALQMLQNIRHNDSLRPQYQIIFNQGVVLLVSVFASAMGDMFRQGINELVKAGKSETIRKEELQLTIGELEDYGYDLSDRLGHLIAEKKDISFQDMKSIARALREYFSVEIAKDNTVNNIIFAQAARHIIVHDAAKVNERFLRQIQNATPRDVKPNPQLGDAIRFETDELTQIGNSMLSYFSTVRGKLEKQLTQ